MMGAGKSTIGLMVSNKLNYKFIDIDDVIEKTTGSKIVDLFKDKGEAYFRDLEEQITLDLLKSERCVFALGGGSFLNNKIRKQVLKENFSIWLNWKEETLIKRIKHSKKRPVVMKISNLEISDLIIKRSKIYSKAKYMINCDNLNKVEIVKKIIKIYETK